MKKQTHSIKSGLLLPSGSIIDRARNEVCRRISLVSLN